jgi:thiamine pyrophosphokinase
MAGQPWVIFAAGDWCEDSIIETWRQHASTIVACDGALKACLDRDIVPDVFVGDGDSVCAETLQSFLDLGGAVHLLGGQDENDLNKALMFAEERGARTCMVFGSTGGDRQHEWANLLACAASPLDVVCLDKNDEYRFFNPLTPYSIDFMLDQEFSLFALPKAEGISLTGCAYPLNKDVLLMGSKGLHNHATETMVNLHFEAGHLMMIRPRGLDEGAGTNEAS